MLVQKLKDGFGFFKKMSILQKNLEYNHRFKRMLRNRAYRVFLHERNGYLPSYKKLCKWRKTLFIIAYLSLFPYPFTTIFFYQLMFEEQILGVTTLPGMLFLIFLAFAMTLDLVINKRWNKGIINYSIVHQFQ